MTKSDEDVEELTYPLCRAAELGETDTVRTLLGRGAAIQAKSYYGRTALNSAAYNGHLDTVRLLLECGADVHAKDDVGETALHRASEYYYSQTVRLLLEHGADIHAKNDQGRTALHGAAWRCMLKVLRVLVDHGADLEAKDDYGCTPLSFAIISTYDFRRAFHTTKLLCDVGAPLDDSCDPSERNSNLADGIYACAVHWTGQRESDPSVELTDIPFEVARKGKASVEAFLNAIATTVDGKVREPQDAQERTALDG